MKLWANLMYISGWLLILLAVVFFVVPPLTGEGLSGFAIGRGVMCLIVGIFGIRQKRQKRKEDK